VCQGDLPGVGPVAAADQAGVGDGVVVGAERPLLDQGHIRRKLVRYGIDSGGIQSFFDGHIRQDAGEGPGQKGLTRAGRAFHK